MTLGIGLAFSEGIMIVSDGRTSLVGSGAVENDETQKIFSMGPSVQIMIFGVTLMTSFALDNLRKTTMPTAAKDAIKHVGGQLAVAWDNFRLFQRPAVDLNHPSICAVMMLGGIDAEGPYVALASFDQTNRLLVSEPRRQGENFGFIVRGAEQHFAETNFFLQYATASAQKFFLNEPQNQVQLLRDAAARTIGEISKFDKTVGGRMHYRALLMDGRSVEGVIEVEPTQPGATAPST